MVISNGHLAIVRIDYNMKNGINSAHKTFLSPPVCCKFISVPKLLDSCDSAVKYSYKDSRKDRLSHFHHLLVYCDLVTALNFLNNCYRTVKC